VVDGLWRAYECGAWNILWGSYTANGRGGGMDALAEKREVVG